MAGLLALLKHEERIGPGWLLDCCVGRCDFFRVVDVRGPDDLPPPETCAAVVLSGRSLDPGLYAAKDRLLRAELVFVRTVVGLGINYLGIGCGAQVLAWALRGEVLTARDERIGQDRIELTEEGARDRLLGAHGGRLPVVRVPTHRVALPPTATLLAGTREEPEAFRMSETAYGVVPHLEVTPLMLDEGWLGGAGGEPLEEVRAHEGEQRSAAWAIMERLIERARDFCPDKPLVSDTDEPLIPT